MQGNTFGQYLKRLRKEKGLTTTKLAEMAGCSRSYLSLVENDKRAVPGTEILIGLAVALGINPSDLLFVAHGSAINTETPEAVKDHLKIIHHHKTIDQCKREITAMLQKVDDIKSALQQALEELGDTDE